MEACSVMPVIEIAIHLQKVTQYPFSQIESDKYRQLRDEFTLHDTLVRRLDCSEAEGSRVDWHREGLEHASLLRFCSQCLGSPKKLLALRDIKFCSRIFQGVF